MVQFSSALDGSAISGLQALDGFRAAGWRTHAVFAHDGPMIARYRRAGHGTCLGRHKNWLRQPKPWQFVRNWRAAARDARAMVPILRSLAPSAVYVNSGASYAGASAAQQLRLPTVWHIRELMASEGGELHAPRGFRRVVRRCFHRLASRKVANSRHVALAVLGTSEALQVVHNAVDDSYFTQPTPRSEARRRLGLEGDATVVGIPGTMREMKGHLFALKALTAWLRADGTRRIIISGQLNGPYAHSVRDFIRRTRIELSVDLVGSQCDMRLFYDACDVALVPSVSEPFGRVAIEAMARGVPVVTSRSGGLPEVVQDQVTGLTVEYGDADALRRAVASACGDEALRERLRRRASEDVRRRFSLPRYQQQLVDVVTDLVEDA